MNTQANLIHKPGPPSSFSYESIQLQEPAPDEVLVEHRAIGVNFIDTYYRSGLYPWPGDMPIVVGAEASGIIVSLGAAVNDLHIGDRIAYTMPFGAYCQHRLLPASRVVKLPAAIEFETAAAVMLKGLTSHYLLHGTFKVTSGHTILFHAAAGGVGLLAGQWAAYLGATVIGTVGSAEKAQLALAHGYHHVINYREQDFVEKVQEITQGKGVDVVYDSVGKSTYPHSLKCLKRLGMWVCFGQSSGVIEDFNLQHLAQHGSLFTTRPTLFDYIPTKESLQKASGELFKMVKNGQLKVAINQKFDLRDAAQVHQLLESRQTKGSTILIP